MASSSPGASATSAHIVDIGNADDLRRCLGEIHVAEGETASLLDRLLRCTLKLQGVDTRAADLLRATVESLGGAVAVPSEALRGAVAETDLLVSGSRSMYRLLAERARGEPSPLPAIAEELLARTQPAPRVMTWAGRTLDFRRRTVVMGILNATPDSFYPGSRSTALPDAVAAARAMVDAGVDIIDVGGESSRPGSDPVPAGEEILRVVPAIEAVRRFSDVLISVDTRKAEVAERALEAGADIVNDISGLRDDPAMAGLVARRGVPVVVMHMRGTPKTMQQGPSYRDTVGEILRDLEAMVAAALDAGIHRDRIILDPGIGFGKRVQDNLRILRGLPALKSLGFPVLVGLSRKAFIGEITGRPVEERLVGTVTANTLAVMHGADIVRVHDAAEAVQMAAVIDAVRQGAAAGA